MRNERFEWDDEKARRNIAKHGLSFETAVKAFDDPNHLDDDEPDPDEERYNRLCMYAGAIFMITYVERGHWVRIISARRADRHEQRRYIEQG